MNVFDFWNGRDLGRLLRTLRIEDESPGFSFEKKLRTEAGGSPPNLDLVFRLRDGRLAGVECKFTEWMEEKRDLAGKLTPYIKKEWSRWSRAGLPKSDQLARDVESGAEIFRFLDVPQLLKHALGLVRASAPGWSLRYLFYQSSLEPSAVHEQELTRFNTRVGEELRFHALTYQSFVAELVPPQDEAEAAYLAYLSDRYFPTLSTPPLLKR